ncbi:MAG: hypothetical protein KGD58_18600 [Candidatus Lokiarchaeota archaeon]|nr:hypothetical protein [Candidatus Lokiarchaeota archaeon]
MPHLASFRRGWESENLARFILYKFSFIANPSTVSDDIGIDFFCTLFQRQVKDNREYLIPRNSFAIQIKSNTDRLDFTNKLQYLEQLELPLFIGVADRNEMKLTIYSGEYLPLLFSQIGLPKVLEIDFKDRNLVTSNNFYHQENDKCILMFPKTLEIEATIDRDELIQKIDLLIKLVSDIQDNLSSKRNGEYIFKLIKPNLADAIIFAGSGSYNSFRHNFLLRLAEVYYNLAWIYTNSADNFNREEYELFKGLYLELEKIYQELPDVVKFPYTELIKTVEGSHSI